MTQAARPITAVFCLLALGCARDKPADDAPVPPQPTAQNQAQQSPAIKPHIGKVIREEFNNGWRILLDDSQRVWILDADTDAVHRTVTLDELYDGEFGKDLGHGLRRGMPAAAVFDAVGQGGDSTYANIFFNARTGPTNAQLLAPVWTTHSRRARLELQFNFFGQLTAVKPVD